MGLPGVCRGDRGKPDCGGGRINAVLSQSGFGDWITLSGAVAVYITAVALRMKVDG